MIKESRNIKMERRINYAKAQAAEYTALLADPAIKQWPEFAKEVFRKKRAVLNDEVRRLEGRQVFFKKLREEQKGLKQ